MRKTPKPQAEPTWVDVAAELRPLAEMYLARKREEVAEIRAAIDAADFSRLRVFAHNLKGSGGAYGLPQLSELGARMEGAAIGADAEAVRAAITEIEQLLKTARLR